MTEPDKKDHLYLIAGITLITWALYFPPFVIDSGNWFGFNHLVFLSQVHLYIFLIGGILGAALFFTPLGKIKAAWFDRIGRFLYKNDYHLKFLILGLVSLPVFWFLRMPANLLGDGYTVISNIGNEYPVIYKWTERGAIAAVYGVYRLLPGTGLDTAKSAYAVISVLSGGVTLLLFGALALELADDFRKRFFIFCLSIFAGWTLLFFGYAENYPILWPFVTGYIYFAVRYINGKSGFIGASILAAAGVLLHLQVMFYLLSWPVLLISRGHGREIFNKYRRMIIISSLVILAAIAAAFIYRYTTALEFRIHFLPLFGGRSSHPDYAVFSWSHLRDIINLLLLLIPLIPVLIFGAVIYRSKPARDNIDLFLILFSSGGIVLLLLLDPRLGMGRDWDLFALTGLGPLLYLSRRVAWWLSEKPRYLSAIVFFSALLIYPFVAVNIQKEPGEKYFINLLEENSPKSKASMVVLRDYYYNTGRKNPADSINRVILDNYPLDRLGRDIDKFVRELGYERALRLADSIINAEPYNSESWNFKAAVFYFTGYIDSAIHYFDQSRRLKPYDYQTMLNLGSAYMLSGNTIRALEYLHKARNIRPDNAAILLTLAQYFFKARQPDSMLYYAEEAIEHNPDDAVAYMAAGTAAFQLRLAQKAQYYLNRHLELKPQSGAREQAEKMLEALRERKK